MWGSNRFRLLLSGTTPPPPPSSCRWRKNHLPILIRQNACTFLLDSPCRSAHPCPSQKIWLHVFCVSSCLNRSLSMQIYLRVVGHSFVDEAILDKMIVQMKETQAENVILHAGGTIVNRRKLTGVQSAQNVSNKPLYLTSYQYSFRIAPGWRRNFPNTIALAMYAIGSVTSGVSTSWLNASLAKALLSPNHTLKSLLYSSSRVIPWYKPPYMTKTRVRLWSCTAWFAFSTCACSERCATASASPPFNAATENAVPYGCCWATEDKVWRSADVADGGSTKARGKVGAAESCRRDSGRSNIILFRDWRWHVTVNRSPARADCTAGKPLAAIKQLSDEATTARFRKRLLCMSTRCYRWWCTLLAEIMRNARWKQ